MKVGVKARKRREEKRKTDSKVNGSNSAKSLGGKNSKATSVRGKGETETHRPGKERKKEKALT